MYGVDCYLGRAMKKGRPPTRTIGGKNTHFHVRIQELALDLYSACGRNLSEVARDPRMPSRFTLHNWKTSGKPTHITSGRDWDVYLDGIQELEIEKARFREFAASSDVMDTTRNVVEEGILLIRDRIKDGTIDAKLGDLDRLTRLYAMIDQRDMEKKSWMDAVMIATLTIIAEVVTPQQFSVIRTRMMDLNVKKTATLDMPHTGRVPELPSHERIMGTDVQEAEYEEINADNP